MSQKIIALSRFENTLWIRDENGESSVFDSATGAKIRGPLEVDPDEVLFRAWVQTQREPDNNKLRKIWNARK